MITNALLRIDGVKGLAPTLFEKSSDEHDYWVLEVALPPIREKDQITTLTRALKKAKKDYARQVSPQSQVSLHLAFTGRTAAPTKIDAGIIAILADMGADLEIVNAS
jgi:hypothetical protein